MFLTYDDYGVVVGDDALKVITRCSEGVRANAEAEAIEEVAGYLRPRFDTGAVFAARMGDRNPQVVMAAVDIALYHMVSSLPQKMGMEIRRERYERAVKWLEGVAAGKIVPDLPRPDDEAGNVDTGGSGTEWFSEPRQRHNW